MTEDLRIDSRMKVKTFKANFKKAFGASLRVYTTPTHGIKFYTSFLVPLF